MAHFHPLCTSLMKHQIEKETSSASWNSVPQCKKLAFFCGMHKVLYKTDIDDKQTDTHRQTGRYNYTSQIAYHAPMKCEILF